MSYYGPCDCDDCIALRKRCKYAEVLSRCDGGTFTKEELEEASIMRSTLPDYGNVCMCPHCTELGHGCLCGYECCGAQLYYERNCFATHKKFYQGQCECLPCMRAFSECSCDRCAAKKRNGHHKRSLLCLESERISKIINARDPKSFVSLVLSIVNGEIDHLIFEQDHSYADAIGSPLEGATGQNLTQGV